MTSVKFSGFWTLSPLSVPNPRNLPSFGQNLANPLAFNTDIIYEWPSKIMHFRVAISQHPPLPLPPQLSPSPGGRRARRRACRARRRRPGRPCPCRPCRPPTGCPPRAARSRGRSCRALGCPGHRPFNIVGHRFNELTLESVEWTRI